MTVTAIETKRARIGGSDAAAACGVDRFRSRVALWAELRGLIPPPEDNEAMLWGKLLQPVIADVLGSHGYDVMPAPADALTSTQHPFMVGHPDAYVSKDAGALGVCEIKTTSSWLASEWDDDAVPAHALLQAQHYLALTGLEWALIAGLIGGQKLEVRAVDRDDELIAVMIEREADLIDRVRRDVPPAPDGSDSDTDAVRRMFPRSTGETIREDVTMRDLRRELLARREQLAAVERQAKELEQAYKLRIGTAERVLSLHDEEVATWPHHERHTLDGKRLRADHPRIADKYTTVSTVRRLTIR